ncbi:type III-B CRISPR module RAMP protein Cmr4 [Methanotrichaceae archaeon Mx]|uniref:Type III-B CRISPR module RAMP protein Cmr4 n=2 Tax=Candidatus Methanocrinis natronophilus TaxID=3033396 RepID=A0ABT5X4P0_9EURY|nr:type III-B CRISPR module RAMP protein Cmr4 [Candidatus Methanocrinis natronophilus]
MQAITPLHVGSGKGVGFIDMPIIREKVTSWPLVPGSAVKGVMRDNFHQTKDDERKAFENLINAAFGRPEDDSGNANSGSLIFTDARIVCLPIRSLYGTFAFVSSPMVLERLKRDLVAAEYKEIPQIPEPIENEALHAPGSRLAIDNKIFFEDLDFTAKQDDDKTNKWAELLAGAVFAKDSRWQSIFKERFVIVSDNSFNFLSETGTEVASHIRIEDDRKIVAKGALWYEEALPVETILAGIVWCDRVYGGNDINQNKILSTFCSDSVLELQIGGKATVGKGRVRCLFTKG